MAQEEKWIEWIAALQGIAQAGLYYTTNDYDRERFQKVRDIAAEMLSHQADIPLEKTKDLFCCEVGYQTPKIDTRAAIFQDDKILLVQERNGTWSLPGGWCEPGISVQDSAIKEVKEEAGLDVVIDTVVAIQDRERHNQPRYVYKICKIFLLATVVGGAFHTNLETVASGYFSLDDLPPLAEEKNNREQILLCHQAYHTADWKTIVE